MACWSRSLFLLMPLIWYNVRLYLVCCLEIFLLCLNSWAESQVGHADWGSSSPLRVGEILYKRLELGSADFFCKWPDSKYFWLCKSYNLSHTQPCHRSGKAALDNMQQMGRAVLQSKFMKTSDGPGLGPTCGLPSLVQKVELMGGPLPQCMHLSNRRWVPFKYFIVLLITYTLIKLEKNLKKKGERP